MAAAGPDAPEDALRYLTDTANGVDWTIAPEPYGILPSPRKPRKNQGAEERALFAPSLRRAKERKRNKDPARAARLASGPLGLWRQGTDAFAAFWRSEANTMASLSVEMFQTAEAKLTRAEAGSTASVTGLWMSIPLSADPVVGVVLLSGVGTWPPPDGV